MQTFIDIDTNIFLYLNGLHNAYWDNFMMMFSGKFIWVPMYAAFLWMVWRCFSWRSALTVTVMGVVLIALADQTCATLIRPWSVCAPRVWKTSFQTLCTWSMVIGEGYTASRRAMLPTLLRLRCLPRCS